MSATWILVADSSRARLFTADGALGPLQEIESFTHPACRARNQDLTSDRHGKASTSSSTSMQSDVEPKRQEALVFAKELSERLRDGRTRGAFAKLYIAAAPAFLGLLRGKLDTSTAQLVVEQLNKDLTLQDPATIRRHLPERL